MNGTIRKTTFWCVGTGDSSEPQTQNTQEEHEDFDVRWIVAAEAGKSMSYEDDMRKWLRKCYSLFSSNPLIEMLKARFRNPYLDLSQNTSRESSFLSIVLGGNNAITPNHN